MKKLSLLVAASVLSLCATAARAQQITGEYVETRNMDVYSGQCFANSESGLVGDQAIMAWRVSKGEWNGVKLDGLSIVGITRGAETLGYQFTNPYPAKAVLIVDEKANAEQREALTAFAHTMGGRLFETVTRTETAPISLQMEFEGEHPTYARVKAGNLAAISTRPITDKDKICGHEETLFKPLTPTAHVMPAVATQDEFGGTGLGVTWSLSGRRSAYIGHFVK
ncbi:MAG: DUF1326 domain-containing protein [Acidobacteria bacterium]|nr:DUF1326 domain-containing protein [Acidobacteriota bacterium]MBI3427008.1 DUF1326 domain-containing protein [Acidobacteriota bacterium]